MDAERDEFELALRARNGDREALAELVERTRLRLFATAYGELRHYEDAQGRFSDGSARFERCKVSRRSAPTLGGRRAA